MQRRSERLRHPPPHRGEQLLVAEETVIYTAELALQPEPGLLIHRAALRQSKIALCRQYRGPCSGTVNAIYLHRRNGGNDAGDNLRHVLRLPHLLPLASLLQRSSIVPGDTVELLPQRAELRQSSRPHRAAPERTRLPGLQSHPEPDRKSPGSAGRHFLSGYRRSRLRGRSWEWPGSSVPPGSRTPEPPPRWGRLLPRRSGVPG